ncbi:MAG: hypothetical protein EKK41_21235 [Hyphomicrobiales bacterium]|nr:MAG: hypothetical protein EKK41_21235 [Hyphomicrobiales bacterium]
MVEGAPDILLALERGFGATVRQSSWAYPAANVLHIIGLTVLAGSVAVMDARLLGLGSGTPWPAVVRPARRVAVAALCLMLASGSLLFAAEASHLALNPVFQAKMALLLFAVGNAGFAGTVLRGLPPDAGMPAALRASACLSGVIWIAIAGLGRTIAYF